MPEQTPEELLYLKPGDILGLKPLVKRDPPTFGTYGQSTDAGDATLFVTVVVKRRMSAWRPGTFEIGNE